MKNVKDEGDVTLMDSDARAVYEISKLTNATKQILDDFNSSITMLMFTQFLLAFDGDAINTLDAVLDKWENTILLQKRTELETLTQQTDSMFDMTIGAALADSEDMAKYIDDVAAVKRMLKITVSKGLKYE